MKYKVCLLFTFLSLSVYGISATNGQDSIRQIQLSDLEVQIRWVNPTAIRAYLDDTKTALGGKAPALYEKLSRLETLLPGVQQAFSDKVSGNTVDEVIGQAQEILALKREIILANPLLDMDKIIVARYRLGNKARKAMGPSMGTSTANYNSLFPTRVKATMPRSTCSRACADKSKAAGYTNPKPMFPFQTYSSTGMPTASSSPRSTRTGSGRYTK